MKLRMAVIPAAGLGTRMLPAAKAVPKEMLPVVDRPTIQWVVEEAAAARVSEAVVVISAEKGAIRQHFRADARLERRLRRVGREGLLASLHALRGRVKMRFVEQRRQRGLGDAVYQARRAVGDEPFLCMLGDTIFSGGRPPALQLAEAYARLGTPVIGLEAVDARRVERYGIVGGTEVSPGIVKIETLVEKPTRRTAPSRLAIAARYVLTPDIFDCLERTKAGRGGEIQLTDALKLLLERRTIHGVVLEARRHDVGDPAEWLRTNVYLARQGSAGTGRLDHLS